MENLLLALYLAPSCSTLHGRLRHRINPAMFAHAVRSRGSGFVTMSLSGASSGAADPSEAVESKVEVWIGDDDRSRVDEGATLRSVSAGRPSVATSSTSERGPFSLDAVCQSSSMKSSAGVSSSSLMRWMNVAASQPSIIR